jgi:hypothetical protein
MLQDVGGLFETLVNSVNQVVGDIGEITFLAALDVVLRLQYGRIMDT